MTATAVAAAPTTAWRNRITGSGEEAPDQLLANPANWRIHPKAQQDALAGRARRRSAGSSRCSSTGAPGFVVDGHAPGRAGAIAAASRPSRSCTSTSTPEEEALVLATLDPIGAMAGRDDEKLRALLADVTVDDAGLLALLGDLGGNEPKAGLTDPDDVPELPDGAVRQAGRALAPRRPPPPVRRRDEPRRRGPAPRRRGADAPRDRPALRRPARPDLARRRVQRAAQAGEGLGRRGRRREAVHDGARSPRRRRGDAAGAGTTPRATATPRSAGDTRADWSEAFALVPVAPGRLRLVRERPHPRGRCRACSRIGFEIVASRSSGTRASSRSGRSWYHWAHEPCWVVRQARRAAPVPRRARPGDDLAGAQPEEDRRRARRRRRRTTRPRSRSSSPRSRSATTCGRARRCYDPFCGSGTTLIAAETPRPSLLRDGDRPPVRPGRDRALAALHRPDGGARPWVGGARRRPRRGQAPPRRDAAVPGQPARAAAPAGRAADAARTWTTTAEGRLAPGPARDARHRRHPGRRRRRPALLLRGGQPVRAGGRAVRAVGPARPRRDGELVKNPLHQVVRDNADEVRLFARELGLSPSARAGLRVEPGATLGATSTTSSASRRGCAWWAAAMG